MLKLPGLIDPHVHLRYLNPENTEYLKVTNAAIAGGFTMVLDMPNNKPPITTLERLNDKMNLAKKHQKYDVGFYFGSLGDNLEEFEKVKEIVYGLKLYLNLTTGGYIINKTMLKKIYLKWNEATNGKKPILVHAEDDVFDSVARMIEETKQPTHICHVATKDELKKIINLKMKDFPITCGVTPHHLFLSKDNLNTLGPYGLMRPSLKTKMDQDFLWENFKYIDIVESDHAPHTRKAKESKNPPFGVPGLETTLPLLLTAMNEKRITKNEILEKCYTRPKKIFNLPNQPETYLEIDEKEEWTIKNENLFTQCGWTPFDGWKVKGKLKKVYLRGKKVFENGKILAEEGFGKII